MDKWEYEVVRLSLDDETDRLSATVDGKTVLGMANILNQYGQQGWELVNTVPAYSEHSPQTAGITTIQYIGVFKRCVEFHGETEED